MARNDNFMKANSGKSHLLMSGTETTHANVDGSMIKSSQKEILLGINLDSELKFEDHVNFICKKASKKLYALARIAPFMDLKQRRNIMKAFVESQFGYCPLIWMFHSRGLKINRIHERALRITIAIQIYKVLHGFSPPNLNDIFAPVSRPYNFRRNDILQRRRVNSVRHGTESVSFLGPQIWDLLPSDIKLSQSLSIFKRKFKKWVPLQCPCRLYKIYPQHVGFIQWTPENSLHRNGGVPWSGTLMNVCTNCVCGCGCGCVCVCVFVYASLFTLIWKIDSGKIASPAQWQSWRQLALCYYCRGDTKIFLCKWVILSQL